MPLLKGLSRPLEFVLCCYLDMMLPCLSEFRYARLGLDKGLPVAHLLEFCQESRVERFPGGLEKVFPYL